MGKLFSLIVLVALGYTGLYFYYGVVVKQEIQQQLDSHGLSAVSVDNVEYGVWAPVSTSANISVTVTYRGSQAALDLAVQGHPVFSDEVSVQFDGLQALRLGIGFGL
ncbi:MULTISPECIES: hypothetical protein [Halomonadaceae]|uniref:DUF945 domain-containing protein n=1 Tax=Vreelandella nigrificans TaxID=2042704 RepID=A0A2A4HII5_9GAMM|nr:MULTISPECIES: hypothetical protein [Halomonas]AQU85178.1 hypothetical protein B2G49_11690 [Halomonas sp. 'Soap Lake \